MSRPVVWIAHVRPASDDAAHSVHTMTRAGELLKATQTKARAVAQYTTVPPLDWTKAQFRAWLRATFPDADAAAFAYDGATLARGWERDGTSIVLDPIGGASRAAAEVQHDRLDGLALR